MFLPWPHRGLGADFSAIDQDSQMSTQATNQSEENTNAIQKMITEIRYIWLGKQRTTCTRKPGPSGSSRPARESNQQKLHTAPPRPNPTLRIEKHQSDCGMSWSSSRNAWTHLLIVTSFWFLVKMKQCISVCWSSLRKSDPCKWVWTVCVSVTDWSEHTPAQVEKCFTFKLLLSSRNIFSFEW